MSRLCITSARLLDPEACEPREASLLLENGRILAQLPVDEPVPEGAQALDLAGAQIAPGFIDLHIHGELLLAAPSELPQALRHDALCMVRHGVTAFLATTIARPREPLASLLTDLSAALETLPAEAAVPLGLHLEGPWLNPAAAGAQPITGIRPFDPGEGEDVLARTPGTLRMVTLAPEIAGARDLLNALTRAGVVAALGHSLAAAEDIDAAVTHGLTHVTHLFNAMGPLHHRQPGVAGLALTDDRLSCDLICDGAHVHPRMVRLAARAKPGRLAMISDRIAIPAQPSASAREAGRANARADFGSGPLRDDGNAWRLPDGRLAGSTLQLDRALHNLRSFAATTLLEAVAACTLVPARVLGIERERGTLRSGARADLAVLDATGGLRETWIGGQPVYRVPGTQEGTKKGSLGAVQELVS